MRRMSDTDRTLRRWLLPVLLVLAPTALGLATGSVGERTAVGAAVLWTEPFLLAFGLYAALALAAERRPGAALGLLLGLTGGALALRRAPEPILPAEEDADWAELLRDCANLPQRAQEPVRLIHWTLSPRERQWIDTDMLLRASPDIVVLHGLQDADPIERLARALQGEAKLLRVEGTPDSVGLVVRGAFQYCGSEEDSWAVTLPGAEGRGARTLLTFPEVSDVGIVPLLSVQLSRAGRPAEWRRWPDRLVEGARQTAALATAIGPRRMVVTGDFGAPPTFRRVASHLLGAGLMEVAVPATWPARVAAVPALPVHALDRVWVGESWADGAARVLDAGVEPRAPLLVELNPI